MYPDKVYQIIFNVIVGLYCKHNSCDRLQVIYVRLNKAGPVIK